ncbi:hypothetical protein D0869_13807 [Hortaea werneckii]|uniref:Protein BFR2 n=1 Tax=Hortaea werneckii TaxID=91943 RepID=A0A3M6ZHM0_HORWE|nr:TRAUB-domain-containing protein [Hortaea werneckii]KAI7020512.1 TRAUB-domain-containing protein [Hortaea werneckii]KAI7179198.1 TRAUB-domain-containing protein [Hortaea werneckii]KAI7579642.1 TRAUB-domain-containing protein [Hortaea werneckii]KAI7674813.1 TRAUB-domain-containing protein [Hortaea werneckii]
MAPNRGRSRAKEFEDEIKPQKNDFDPEADDGFDESGSDDGAGDDDAPEGGREHYVDVGKSKLRRGKDVALGPQYRGSKVSRRDMSDDEEDDPFSKGFDEEESEAEDPQDDFGSSGEEDDQDEDDEDETPDTDMDEDEDEGAARPRLGAARNDADLAEARKAMADEQKQVAATLTQASQADAEKGRAVKKQRTAFDALLGARMKLQKGLVGANTLVGMPEDDINNQRETASDAISAAETAAFNLWSSLTSFRDDLISARTGEKRKRSAFTTTTPTSKLWTYTQDQEESFQPHRTATLQKWSAKTRGPSALPQQSRLNNTAQQTGIMDVINEQLTTNSERLLKRAQTPRSCAPLQLSHKVTEDSKIYDDADFYGLLLKELLEQKSADSVAASNIDLSFQMRRDNKTKKNVDTKASKGRKLRYTVHEKLQNFMVPEDRASWGERQTDELFGSLFGQRLGLAEDGKEGEGEQEMEDQQEVDPAEAGLMMFRG